MFNAKTKNLQLAAVTLKMNHFLYCNFLQQTSVNCESECDSFRPARLLGSIVAVLNDARSHRPGNGCAGEKQVSPSVGQTTSRRGVASNEARDQTTN